tara:strand:- start:4032 stop:4652 length:621 start_codon:yes stop_codon:yes gene_type:complete
MIDILYYINLDRRTDRLQNLEENVLPSINLEGMKKHRIPAIDHTGYSHVSQRTAGCSLSHIRCWKDAIKEVYNKIMVVEDDFELVKNEEEVNQILEELKCTEFGVCNLGYANWAPLRKIEGSIFYRCNNIQTTSCYVASVPFLKTMLPHIEDATEKLMRCEDRHINAIDMAWKKFQKTDDWMVSERIGKQKASYSDIERGFNDYGV